MLERLFYETAGFYHLLCWAMIGISLLDLPLMMTIEDWEYRFEPTFNGWTKGIVLIVESSSFLGGKRTLDVATGADRLMWWGHSLEQPGQDGMGHSWQGEKTRGENTSPRGSVGKEKKAAADLLASIGQDFFLRLATHTDTRTWR